MDSDRFFDLRRELFQEIFKIEACSGYDMLDYSGSNWPQPSRLMGEVRFDWDHIQHLLEQIT